VGRLAALLLILAVACDERVQDATPDPLAIQSDTEFDTELIEQLSALGYVDGIDPAGGASGVTQHDPQRVSPGLNLFTSGHGAAAVLMDMDGEILHQWQANFSELFPQDRRARKGKGARRKFWRAVRLFPNGDLIVIWDLYGIFKLDRDSRILWSVHTKAHHDFQVTKSGEIIHLEAVNRELPEIPGGDSVEDVIVVRNAQGRELRRLSIPAALGSELWLELRARFWQRGENAGYPIKDPAHFDPFHTNAVRILSEEESDRLGEPFQSGDVLVSMAMLDTIAVIDMARGAARWWQQGPFGMQHHPRVTREGRFILFNNFLTEERSSVQILDPHTRSVTWEYEGTDADPIYSQRSGSAEQLENGNVLIVVTDRGRALEVTPDKEGVWEFKNPFRAGKQRQVVANIYSLQRVPSSKVAWLESRADQASLDPNGS
jgi:hypothetical protein